MTLRTLEYQERVLGIFDKYLSHLIDEKIAAVGRSSLLEDGRSASRHTGADYPRGAWDKMRNSGLIPTTRMGLEYSSKLDGCGRPVPNVVFKVPTGGGKTWLAVSAISRLFGRYIGKNNGFVLWIVPNEAIYTQTLKNFKDRQHPYRMALDRIAAGRVAIFEKFDSLKSADVEGNLCVMLLMLQSANRDTKETLRMFKDRGDIHGFFPSEGEQNLHRVLIENTRNLDIYDYIFGIVKDSLGNALRVIRPVVVLDEGHRATSSLAYRTLYGFNPSFVLELTATPQDTEIKGAGGKREVRNSNVLVEVSGLELEREEMIKMPINLNTKAGSDWRITLHAAIRKLNNLRNSAELYKSETNQYIRPILLVQVERTGKEQRGSGYIHAEDVRDELLASGFDQREIAIKSADVNDLRQPENIDILSPSCCIRVIVTSQALREGWDCSFAYVLCSLAASKSLTAMTQLVGRILRQPYAEKSDVNDLNECYVFTHHASTSSVVEAVKTGLIREGLGDLVVTLNEEEGEAVSTKTRTERRQKFREKIVQLPRVLVNGDDAVRDLDYITDILSSIDWRGYDPSRTVERIPINARSAEQQMSRVVISNSKSGFSVEYGLKLKDETAFDAVYAVRMISDVVPNPFVARQIIENLIQGLYDKGFSRNKLGELTNLIVNELLADLQTDELAAAEAIFKSGVETGKILFKLRMDGKNWIMPEYINSNRTDNEKRLLGSTGVEVEKSMFVPVFRDDFNEDERRIAVYLDSAETVKWWHRNVARQQYGLRGWSRNIIYPDFIFEVCKEGTTAAYSVIETKGDHLENKDTAYKRAVLRFLSESFTWDDVESSGELELIRKDGVTLHCDLVLMSDIETVLPMHL